MYIYANLLKLINFRGDWVTVSTVTPKNISYIFSYIILLVSINIGDVSLIEIIG